MTQLSISPGQLVAAGACPTSDSAAHDIDRRPVSCEGMTGQSIICFAKDWDEDPTSNNHIMQLLARGNRVLWLNSIATRKPNLRSARDLTKIFRKLASFFRGPKHISEGLWVYTPVVLPFPHSRIANRVNAWIMRIALAVIRWRLGISDFQLWVFLPTAAPYVGTLGESLVVYYVTDEYSRFGHVDGDRVAKDDRSICRKADVIFATAQSLVEKRLALNTETHLSRHGVAHASFASALDDATQVSADLAALPKPVLGFHGALQDWLDYDLIEYLASRHRDWSIALIGQPLVDLTRLRQLPNVHILGRKPHAQLPAYCKGMSVAMIPHKVNELTVHMNPIKLREYLSAGLPVVSVELPEVEPYAGQCCIARDYEQFERGIEEALRSDSPEKRLARSDAMRTETWERRVAEIGSQVMRVQDNKHSSAAAKSR